MGPLSTHNAALEGRDAPLVLGAVLVGRFLHHPLLSQVLSLGPAAALA